MNRMDQELHTTQGEDRSKHQFGMAEDTYVYDVPRALQDSILAGTPNSDPGIPDEVTTTLSAHNDHSDMRHEVARLKSFTNWPKLGVVRPEHIAKAGMFFMGPGDRVKCAFCKGQLDAWDQEDDPREKHRKYFGARCPFIRGIPSGNVPIGESPPRCPEFLTYQRRLASFGTWRSSIQTPENLANAGFFYTGTEDEVRCYFCGGTLETWQPEDDPWDEHARWFPRCNLLEQTGATGSAQSALNASSIIRITANEILQAENSTMSSLTSNTHNKRMRPHKNSVAKFDKQMPSNSMQCIDKQGETADDNIHRYLAGEYDGLMEQRLCKKCCNVNFDTLFSPCGHLVCCHQCAALLSQCPVCRQPIADKLRVVLGVDG